MCDVMHMIRNTIVRLVYGVFK